MKHFSELSATAERVLDAAEGLVQQRGYNGFSYDDVAGLVGIKKPSIHHHFPTKSDLVAVVTQRYTHRFHNALLAIEAQHVDAPGRLRAYAGLFEQTFAHNRRLCVCGMLGAEAESLPDPVNTEVQAFFRLNLDWLIAVLSEGQRHGTVQTRVCASDLAEACFCALEGSMVVGRGLASSQGPGRVGQTLLSSLLT